MRILILTALLVFLLGACNNTPNPDQPTGPDVPTVTPEPTATPLPTLPPTMEPLSVAHQGHIFPVSTRTTHIVQPGETLGEIANMYGVGVKFVADANRIYNYDLIKVGDEIYIPPCE